MLIWLASYPRSGNTLLRSVFKAVFDVETYSKHADDEADIGVDPAVAAAVGHRPLGRPWPDAYDRMRGDPAELFLVKTHDVPSDAGKAVYVVRDGRAACRSFHHYLRDFTADGSTVADVVAGSVPFGSWGGHLDAWDPPNRPDTLLVRYENLLSDPATQVARLAAFTGLTPRREWHNDFAALHAANPRFFRAGAANDPASALSDADAALFWAAHGDWMAALGYPSASPTGRRAVRAFLARQAATLATAKSAEATAVTAFAEHRAAAAERATHADGRLVEGRAALAELAASSSRALLAAGAELSTVRADAGRSVHLLQKQYAESLQEKQARVAALMHAVREQDARVRMLLTSRFLRLGWNLGFGATPHWAERSRDELTPLIESLDPPAVPTVKPTDATDMDRALAHLKAKGFRPGVILDVGAAKGYWSIAASAVWPDARFDLIDPLPQSEPALRELVADPRFRYALTAVGAEAGTAVINVPADPDSSSLLSPDGENPRPVAVETVDRLIATGRVDPPQLVKLDVQGYELNVLAGGTSLFDSAEAFVVECNLFAFMPGCPRLHEVVAFMADRGFYPFDFAGSLRRPFENDLGQVDVVFVRGTSPMVASTRWVADLAPSPGTPGEGRGEGDCDLQRPFAGRNHPHPLPGYRERGPESGPAVSVVICTRNPRPTLFARVLDALDGQTLPRNLWELVIVDNGSSPPADASGRQARLVINPTPGLSVARCAGIAAATADLLVFVDDDNLLAPEYLERAVGIAAAEPRIGLFGGVSVAELERPIPDWKRPFLPYLGVRDHGDRPITAFADHWGEWEPIGAGMVARRAVAEGFVRMHGESAAARRLGRAGAALLSGEDSLFARAAHRLGYSCSYQPSLRLTHYLPRHRLRLPYLARLLAGHGRSFVLLHRALGTPADDLKLRTAVARLVHRLRTAGRAGAVTWCWDLGYAAEKRAERTAVHASRPNTRPTSASSVTPAATSAAAAVRIGTNPD